MDFQEATRLFAFVANIDRRLAPKSDGLAMTAAAAWNDVLRDVPLDFAMHEARRYYGTEQQWPIQPGVIRDQWLVEEDLARAREERAARRDRRRPAEPRLALDPDASDEDIVATIEERAGQPLPDHMRERVITEYREGAEKGPQPIGGILGRLTRGAPADLREQMRHDIRNGGDSIRDREKRLRRIGVDRFRYEGYQQTLAKQERLRAEYREEPEIAAVEILDADDIAERHCGRKGCVCPHTRCRAGWLDGRDALVETRFGPTHETERCPACWDAVLMQGETT